MTETEIEIFIDEMTDAGEDDWTPDSVRTSSYGKMALEDAIKARIRHLYMHTNNLESTM